jgi:NAD(P)-dependent dehydrogenase (short-subunit alcohol dehydrogenase family)
MKITLKPINKQVVVITGASSGIGRETALQFAAGGAKVVAVAHGEQALQSLVRQIEQLGGEATYQVCDVADFEQVQAAARKAVSEYGRIDTWINNAAINLYATFEQTTPEEFRRIFDVNVMGQVHGCKAALPFLKQQGGVLICVSSVESKVSLPLNSAYASSKHAIAGFVDGLRRELMHEGAPVSVTNIMPGTINTPFFNNARTKIGVKPQGPPPFYQPKVVADVILYAAEHPVRDMIAGGAAKGMVLGQKLAPDLMDAMLATDRFGFQTQKTDEPKTVDAPNNFHAPIEREDRVEGDFSYKAKGSSLYDWLEMRGAAGTLLVGGALGAAALLLARGYGGNGSHGAGARKQEEDNQPTRHKPAMAASVPPNG